MKSSKAIIFFFAVLLCACEGGKPKPRLNCADGEYEDRGQCIANNKPEDQCAANETLINGVCTLQCEEGFHLQADLTGQVCVANTLAIEVVSQNACYDPSNGATRVIIQYIARDENGYAIDPQLDAQNNPTALTTKLIVDGEDIDSESTLAQDSEALRTDLAMSLLLDGSFSMVEDHTPPAFEPMKAAAIELLKTTEARWSTEQSTFYWDVAWFNQFIFRPKSNNAGEPWVIEDIANIPAPTSGTFTGLYKAVNYMLEVHQQWYAAGVAAGDRDQHVLVVLSDGKDNHSSFNDTNPNQEGNYANTLFWDRISMGPVPTLNDIMAPASAAPNLRIHVLGLGDKVDAAELQAIAALGNGQYFYGSSSETLSDLFAQVQRELVTQQTIGVQTPLSTGEYDFTLQTTRISDNATATTSWQQQAGTTLATCAD